MSTLKKFDRPICFQRIFVELTGTITGALFLSQAVYWQNRCDSEDGWWWKTQEDWTEETGMTRHELVSAKETTKKFIRHKLGGVPCRSFWKVDADALDACVQLVESSSPESGELDSRKAANKSAEKRRASKEKTSTENGAVAPTSKIRSLTDQFSSAWAKRFGMPYKFGGAADGKAADELLKLGLSPEEIMAVAIKAWNKPEDFNCKFALSLKGLASRFNEIRAEVGLLNKPKGKNEMRPEGYRPDKVDSNNRFHVPSGNL